MRTLVAFATALALVTTAACSEHPAMADGGDAESGRLLLRQFGCGTCHAIPGVAVAQGAVGPSLDGIARRAYLAGRIPNTPANMTRWIRDPAALVPGTTMPDLSVGEDHARDIAAYLATLR